MALALGPGAILALDAPQSAANPPPQLLVRRPPAAPDVYAEPARSTRHVPPVPMLEFTDPGITPDQQRLCCYRLAIGRDETTSHPPLNTTNTILHCNKPTLARYWGARRTHFTADRTPGSRRSPSLIGGPLGCLGFMQSSSLAPLKLALDSLAHEIGAMFVFADGP